ncbi:MAG: hypothetical protein CVT73_07840 [Alphaproteobacteria bacterium HGW-Alphaproteobacteria-12]|nr:MAG: hypothetical protein CVT73_07840 [Alphaproteobacteria bacterium HGW-Alphaproteobacteria-12]
MSKEITLERLKAILAAYGASPGRWPADERMAAEALLAASAEARGLVADAALFDMLLDEAPLDAPSRALAERLVAARPRAVPPARASLALPKSRGFIGGLVEAVWPYGSPAFPAAALAASLVLGVALGSTTDLAVGTGTTTVTASADATASDDFIALALADTEWPEEWIQ